MRTVITYGTYDLFHEGHRRLLERARALGDRLIVGVTSDAYDHTRGKLNVAQTLPDRIENVRRSGLADQIIVEEYDGQKIHDIEKLGVDVFAIGSDWLGKWEHLRDYCEVVYLERTRGVSSTELRNEASGILHLGLVGAGKRARIMTKEARYVSGVSVEAVWDPNRERAKKFAERMELNEAAEELSDLLSMVDAVYISGPFDERTDRIRTALTAGVNVLAEPPLALNRPDYEELFRLAHRQQVVLMEGVRTAFSPGFLRMVAYARSGSIGKIHSVQITSTRLVHKKSWLKTPYGGSLNVLGTYPLLTVVKLLGSDYEEVQSQMLRPSGVGVDMFTRVDLRYKDALASVSTGIGVASENDIRVTGSKGYLYVPDPWWRTDHFETRFEDHKRNRSFFIPFEGGGQRYELADLAARVRGTDLEAYQMSEKDSLATAGIVDEARESALVFG